MPTLAELEAAYAAARAALVAARERIETAELAAVAAIDRHAVVQARVIGGAGQPEDVTRAAEERDEAIAAFRSVEQELRPRPGKAVTRLAALLRRLADRIDHRGQPTPAEAPEESGPRYRGAMAGHPIERGTVEQVRERQEETLRELEFLIERIREHEDGSGLCWYESWQLEVLHGLFEHELWRREREFERAESGRLR